MNSSVPRTLTVRERIRNSELFPRIRDAEIEMKENEKEFLRSVAEKKWRKEKRREYKEKHKFDTPVKKKGVTSSPKQYFTGFVLDRDPKAKAYMPYDTVYFPKLFDEDCAKVPPESIDKMWMFGFQDLAIQEKREKKKKR